MQIAIDLEPYLKEITGKSECFTHLDDDGTYRHFPIEIMRKIGDQYGGKCKQIICQEIPIEKRQAEYIRANMGIEQDRIDRLASPYLERPLLAITWPEECLTIIDGNHRFVKLYERGVKWTRAYIFVYPIWENLLINLPDDRALLEGNSGILEQERKKQNG